MEIQISGVKKYYHSEGKIIKALDGVNLTIPANKIFTLLGPSGCGKTTLLRSIVGLETPDEGEIRIGDTIVWSSEKRIDVPTEKRGLGMVFQTYAIWPHMDVFNNVAYPLQNMKLPKDEIVRRVEKTLQFVQLEGFGSRPATRLSGGQQQRVALARALVAEPKVILFDEPLSNLDAKLRLHMRTEIRKLQKKLGITCLYVTHDQSEALTMADRIVVMNKGKVEQIGTPFEIYSNPQSLFVADFIGHANIVKLEISAIDGETLTARVPGGKTYAARALKPDKYQRTEVIYQQGKQAALIVRPENIQVVEKSDDTGRFPARVISSIFVGSHIEYELRLENNAEIKASVPYLTGMRVFEEDSEVYALFDSSNSAFLPV